MNEPELKLGDLVVKSSNPCCVIAEIGINHNGSVDTAKKLIDVAKDAGVFAVKFQKRDLESIYHRDLFTDLKNFEQGFQYIIPILRDYELTPDQIHELKEYCDDIGMFFLCTPFDRISAKHLEEIGTQAYKISSADLVNFDLLEYMAGLEKPLLLSTGMSLEPEIDDTVNYLKQRDVAFALLHCVSSYPVDARDANLGRIEYLKNKYRVPVGYSGHDIGTALSVIATTLGARIIEKHITLDKGMRGPDHKVSLLPEELTRLVANVREAEQACRDVRDEILQGELLNKMIFRKSVVAARPIARGQLIERDMITVKSPGTGLSAQKIFELVGKKARHDFGVDDLFYASDLDDSSDDSQLEIPDWAKWGYVVRYHDFEMALEQDPKILEFHFTYNDTLLDLPHDKLNRYHHRLKDKSLRIHCCEYIGEKLFDLCSRYEDVLEESEKVLQRVIDRTYELSQYFNDDTPLIVFNVGAMSLKEDVRNTKIDPDKFHGIINNLDLKNTHLVAQNMPPNPWYFGGQWKGHYFLKAEELVSFCEATDQSICLDLSHAHMACTYLNTSFIDYILQLKPYVKHLHISDARGVEGEGTQIGTGDINFEQFFEAYADYEGSWIPEIWQGHVNNNEGAKLAMRKLHKIWLKTLN